MDLHDFAGDKMYFDEQLNADVVELIDRAAESYASGESELPLLKAYFLAPESLSVLVSLYRYYYYQHCYEEALVVAHKSLKQVSKLLGFSVSWEDLDLDILGKGILQSMTLVRFYLLCLKGAGYLNLRLGNMELGISMIEKVSAVDSQDRLGASILLQVAEGYRRKVEANFGKLTVVA